MDSRFLIAAFDMVAHDGHDAMRQGKPVQPSWRERERGKKKKLTSSRSRNSVHLVLRAPLLQSTVILQQHGATCT